MCLRLTSIIQRLNLFCFSFKNVSNLFFQILLFQRLVIFKLFVYLLNGKLNNFLDKLTSLNMCRLDYVRVVFSVNSSMFSLVSRTVFTFVKIIVEGYLKYFCLRTSDYSIYHLWEYRKVLNYFWVFLVSFRTEICNFLFR